VMSLFGVLIFSGLIFNKNTPEKWFLNYK
jgi:hypothetical protein